MKRIILLVLLLTGFGESIAQRHIKLSLRYDVLLKRYSVLAKCDFTESRFIWGPSQITIIVPANDLVKKLRVSPVSGGAWADQSTVYNPKAQPESNFHGIDTNGDEVFNVEREKELMVFYFTLPDNIDPKGVRLFVNGKDPNSLAPGMKGGDFWNTIIDRTGDDVFSGFYGDSENEDSPVKEGILSTSEEAFGVKVYPNIMTDNYFRVSISGQGISENEEILVIVTDDTGREILRTKGTGRSLTRKKFKLSHNTSGETLTVRVISKRGTVTKRIINS